MRCSPPHCGSRDAERPRRLATWSAYPAGRLRSREGPCAGPANGGRSAGLVREGGHERRAKSRAPRRGRTLSKTGGNSSGREPPLLACSRTSCLASATGRLSEDRRGSAQLSTACSLHDARSSESTAEAADAALVAVLAASSDERTPCRAESAASPFPASSVAAASCAVRTNSSSDRATGWPPPAVRAGAPGPSPRCPVGVPRSSPPPKSAAGIAAAYRR